MKDLRGKGPGILAGDARLIISPDKVGSALSIEWSEPSGSKNQWTIVVVVHCEEGDYILGKFMTRPPYARTGDPANRVVAHAYCPGAKGWRIFAFGPDGARATMTMSTSQLSVGGVAAIVPVNGSQLISNRWSPSPNIGPKALQGIATDGPGTVLEGYGYQDPAGGGGFFGFVDKASAIVNGDLFTIAPFPIPAPVAGVPALLQWNFGDGVADGLRFALQARWCVSATDNVVTLAGPGAIMRVQNKVV